MTDLHSIATFSAVTDSGGRAPTITGTAISLNTYFHTQTSAGYRKVIFLSEVTMFKLQKNTNTTLDV